MSMFYKSPDRALRIYGALIQEIMEKVVHYEKQWPKWPPNFNTFT